MMDDEMHDEDLAEDTSGEFTDEELEEDEKY